MGSMSLKWLALLMLPMTQACAGQEWNLGLSGGVLTDFTLRDASPGLQTMVEYRPKAARFSMNTGAGTLFVEDRTWLTVPFYFKVIFGERVRFCPTLGGLYWTRPAWGVMAGLDVEFPGRGWLVPYLSTNYLTLSIDEDSPSKFGGSDSDRSRVHGLGALIGVKVALN